MVVRVTAKNIELTTDLRQYIERKFAKLSRHLPKILEAKVEIAEQKTRARQQRFIAQVTVDSNGVILRGEERGEELFTAIDKVAAIMDRQIERYKGKRESRKSAVSPRTGIKSKVESESPATEVVKVKQFPVKLMSVDEAIEQMELLGHDFFLFLNKDGGKLNLLYRRRDKKYGIIDPEVD